MTGLGEAYFRVAIDQNYGRRTVIVVGCAVGGMSFGVKGEGLQFKIGKNHLKMVVAIFDHLSFHTLKWFTMCTLADHQSLYSVE